MKLDATIQLRHLFHIVSGSTPDSGNADYWNGDIPWITPEDVSQVDGAILSDTRRKLTAEGFKNSGATIVGTGGIVLTKRAPIGQLALLGLDACSNQGCFLLSAQKGTDSRFFYYVLANSVPILQALGRGSTFMELSTDDLKALRVPVLDHAAQIRIANHLDQETARLDALVEAKQRVLNLLAEKRKAIIATAVTRGLDLNVTLHDSRVPWLGDIPNHWKAERVRWHFRERDQRGSPDLPLMEVSISKGVSVREFSDERIEATASDFNTYKVARKDDIAFNKMRMWQGAVGVAPTHGLVSPDYVVAEPIGSVLPDFAGLLFRVDEFSAECGRRSHGLTWDRLRIYWEEFREIEIPIPPLPEQAAIVAHAGLEAARVDAVRAATERTIGLLKERRSALIAAAVTGQLDAGAAA